jgi:hypothetical protein
MGRVQLENHNFVMTVIFSTETRAPMESVQSAFANPKQRLKLEKQFARKLQHRRKKNKLKKQRQRNQQKPIFSDVLSATDVSGLYSSNANANSTSVRDIGILAIISANMIIKQRESEKSVKTTPL